jgi:hypothetical protein
LPGIGGGELARDREALLVGCERLRRVARVESHVADLIEAQAHIALPAGIAAIGGGELAPDREALLISRECPGPVAGGQPHVADLIEPAP